MILWRLSGVTHARSFDGGYGLVFSGRWNSIGHAVTYCSNSPSLCVLEKLVHVEEPGLLPELVMVRYEAPDTLGQETLEVAELPEGWRKQENWSQQRGDEWHNSITTPLLKVPSAIVPVAGSPDLNFVVNHRHPDTAKITTLGIEPYILDARLL